MVSTFHRLAKANGFSFVHLNRPEKAWEISPAKPEFLENERRKLEAINDRPGVFFDYHSAIPDLSACKASRGARGIHLVRDPRDMLISAVRYHLKSTEAWLDEPDAKWGGRSFRQKLSSYPQYTDQLRFEMDTHMGRTIRNMAEFDTQGVFRNVRYEDLIVDEDMMRFHELCLWLGLTGLEIIRALRVYWGCSVFGQLRTAAQSGSHGHIVNSAARQWETALSPGALDSIQRELGSQIAALGYDLV